MYRSKAFKIVLLMAVLNAIVFGACLYLFTEIKSKNKYIASVASEFASASEKESKIADIKSVIRMRAEDKAYIDAHFVDGGDIAGFFGEVEDLGKQTGVLVEIGTADFTKDKTKKLRLVFKASGSFEAIIRFIELLENFKYELVQKRVAIEKDSMQVVSPDKGKPGIVWRGDFELELSSLVLK